MEKQLEYSADWLESYLNTNTAFDGTLIKNHLDEWSEYIKTGITPQEAAQLKEQLDLARAEVQGLSKQVHELTKKCDYWEIEAKKNGAQLGEIRILAEGGKTYVKKTEPSHT